MKYKKHKRRDEARLCKERVARIVTSSENQQIRISPVKPEHKNRSILHVPYFNMPEAEYKQYDDRRLGSSFTQTSSSCGNQSELYYSSGTSSHYSHGSHSSPGQSQGHPSILNVSQEQQNIGKDRLAYVPMTGNSDYMSPHNYGEQYPAGDTLGNGVVYPVSQTSFKRDHSFVEEELTYGYTHDSCSNSVEVPEKQFKYNESENQRYHLSQREYIDNGADYHHFKNPSHYQSVNSHRKPSNYVDKCDDSVESKHFQTPVSKDSHAILRSTLLQKDDFFPVRMCPTTSYSGSVSSSSGDSHVSSASHHTPNTVLTHEVRHLEQRSYFLIESLLECDRLLDITDLYQTEDLLSNSKDVTKLLCDLGDKIIGKLIKWTKHLTFFKEIPIEAHSQLLSCKWHELLLLITTAYKAIQGQGNNGMSEEELYRLNTKHLQVRFPICYSQTAQICSEG